ncbi:MAG: hypothetical protein HQ521_06665 [Bacteroidetes bacterium]|nr:hypothetical protein [Bacteroidota bacterium]
MMPAKKYLQIWVILLIISFNFGCSKEINQISVKKEIAVLPHPSRVELQNVNFRVINKENLKAFQQELLFESFISISLKDYQNLSLNTEELKRFIQQQKDIILYYENSIKEEK